LGLARKLAQNVISLKLERMTTYIAALARMLILALIFVPEVVHSFEGYPEVGSHVDVILITQEDGRPKAKMLVEDLVVISMQLIPKGTAFSEGLSPDSAIFQLAMSPISGAGADPLGRTLLVGLQGAKEKLSLMERAKGVVSFSLMLRANRPPPTLERKPRTLASDRVTIDGMTYKLSREGKLIPENDIEK
jgi:hypothetical protein